MCGVSSTAEASATNSAICFFPDFEIIQKLVHYIETGGTRPWPFDGQLGVVSRTKYHSQALDMGFALDQLYQLGAVTRGVIPKLPAQTFAWIRRLGLGTQPVMVETRGLTAENNQRPIEVLTTNRLDSINIPERGTSHNNMVAITREAKVTTIPFLTLHTWMYVLPVRHPRVTKSEKPDQWQ